MYQKVVLIGRVGRDAEGKYLQSGDMVTSFSVATSKKWKKDGQDFEETVWWRVTAWRKLAEICNQYVKKGSLVLVEGELAEPKVYQKRDGGYGTNLDITANVVRFVGSKQDRGETAPSGGSGQPSLPDGIEEDIPF
jgi:single-strand DNA-binding protein